MTPTPAPAFHPGHHYDELDSLRGLAALTVLITHYSNIFLVQSGPFVSVGRVIQFLGLTPLFVLFAGHEAVMLFFVHSGFVLSLQFLKGKPMPYLPFAVRRVFRIYVPYLVTLIVVLVCCGLLYRGPIADLSSWFNYPWADGINSSDVGGHVLFIGYFKSGTYDPVLWSLVHEMRISFLFPLLIALVVKRTWKVNLLAAVAVSFVGTTATLALIKFGVRTDYFLTLHYIAMFICGFVLAQNINAIFAWYRRRHWVTRIVLALSGFGAYTFGHAIPGRLGYFQDLPITVGAVLMVITAVCSLKASALLRRPLFIFLGKISYSLYLYHAVFLLAFVHALYGVVPVGVILLMAAAATILGSWLSYKYVELPAIRGGKLCSGWLENRHREPRENIPLPPLPQVNE